MQNHYTQLRFLSRSSLLVRSINKRFVVEPTVLNDTKTFKIATQTRTFSEVLLKITLTKSYFSISSTHLVVWITSVIVYFLLFKSLALNLTFVLLRNSKYILAITSILVSMNRKIFLKNRIFLKLSWKKTLPKLYHMFLKQYHQFSGALA